MHNSIRPTIKAIVVVASCSNYGRRQCRLALINWRWHKLPNPSRWGATLSGEWGQRCAYSLRPQSCHPHRLPCLQYRCLKTTDCKMKRTAITVSNSRYLVFYFPGSSIKVESRSVSLLRITVTCYRDLNSCVNPIGLTVENNVKWEFICLQRRYNTDQNCMANLPTKLLSSSVHDAARFLEHCALEAVSWDISCSTFSDVISDRWSMLGGTGVLIVLRGSVNQQLVSLHTVLYSDIRYNAAGSH